MKLSFLAFSARGLALAERLAAALGGDAARCGAALTLDGWTKAHFKTGAGLVYVGACGIAVRAVAPYLKSKTTDPAVVAVDEQGHFAVPLVSGHLGGANALARAISRACGATPVLTTATDAGGLFPIDDWARRQGCVVVNPGQIKKLSSALLAGGSIRFYSDFAISGPLPAGVEPADDKSACDAALSLTEPGGGALWLAPRVLVLGLGCRRGVSARQLEQALRALFAREKLSEKALCLVASIDRKANEAGILALCAAHGWPYRTFTAGQLAGVAGSFSSSGFVQQVTGVDNVCERAAVLGAEGGRLLVKKQAGDGVTLALAAKAFAPDWSWLDE